jgi:hypothetical protein
VTTTYEDTERDILRAARRAWFRAGVTRADRRRLKDDLAGELAGARAEGGLGSVLGRDPASTAREWAEAQGLTDRRTRIGLLGPSMVAAGALGSGCVLAPVLQALGNGGHSFLNNTTGGATVTLAVYCGAGALAYLAMIAVAAAMLSIVDDASRRRSIRALSIALPLGGALACAGAVAAASALDFAVRPRTFIVVALVVGAVMTATIAGARALVTRGPARPTSDDDGVPSA